MKLTSTVVVQIGALICTTGSLLLSRLPMSPHEIAFLRALVAVILGLFIIQIGYAQSLRARTLAEIEKKPPPADKAE